MHIRMNIPVSYAAVFSAFYMKGRKYIPVKTHNLVKLYLIPLSVSNRNYYRMPKTFSGFPAASGRKTPYYSIICMLLVNITKYY